MTTSGKTTLVLGGTGRTGQLVARGLAEHGFAVRTAARRGADVVFDWDDPTTYRAALDDVDRIYLVTPVMRTRFAAEVAEFLDLAIDAGVHHVTQLSTWGSDRAPSEVDIVAVERDLARRGAITHSILRPAWVMQNFADEHLPVVNGLITVPTGGGAEAFVDAGDIAAVAVETLIDPESHAGAVYAPSGPRALTVAEVAAIISEETGRPIRHVDIEQDTWIGGAVAAGFVPADYAVMLRWLTGTIITGKGARPNDDVERVTGRPATDFRDFVRRNLAVWAAKATDRP